MGYKENSFAFSIAGFSLVCSSHLILMIDEMPRLLLVDDVKKTPIAKESHLVPIPNTNIAETFPTFY